MNRPRGILTTTVIATIAAGLLVGGCGDGQGEAAATIAAATQAFSEAYCSGDTAAVADFYTEDAVMQPPGLVLRGRHEITGFLALDPGEVCEDFVVESVSLTFNGNVAMDRGTWRRTWHDGEGEQQTEKSHYLAVWTRQTDGTWRMSQSMWHAPVGPGEPEPEPEVAPGT